MTDTNPSTWSALRSVTLVVNFGGPDYRLCEALNTVVKRLSALKLARTTHPAFCRLKIVLDVHKSVFCAAEDPSPAGQTPRCVALLPENPLDATLLRLAGDMQLEKVIIRCEAKSYYKISGAAMLAFLRHAFPKLECAQLAEFEVGCANHQWW